MNYAVQEIIKKRKITEYLRSKHILPIGSETSGRFRYKCPLHEGDNTPSFIVYTNSDFENFFCYGCKAKYHIIHLYRELEKISTEEAIKRLSDGLSLNLDSEMDFIIKDLENDYSVSNLFTPIDLSLVMSRQLYDYTKQVDKDTAIYLNDTYELDGRDPNGYVGCAWSIGGLHDRPWFSRPIFGSIRYMATSGVEKRGDTKQYINKWNQ
jgi:hypothetical protein